MKKVNEIKESIHYSINSSYNEISSDIEKIDNFFYELDKSLIHTFLSTDNLSNLTIFIYSNGQDEILDFITTFYGNLISEGITDETIFNLTSNSVVSVFKNKSSVLDKKLISAISVDEDKESDLFIALLMLLRLNIKYALNITKKEITK